MLLTELDDGLVSAGLVVHGIVEIEALQSNLNRVAFEGSKTVEGDEGSRIIVGCSMQIDEEVEIGRLWIFSGDFLVNMCCTSVFFLRNPTHRQRFANEGIFRFDKP